MSRRGPRPGRGSPLRPRRPVRGLIFRVANLAQLQQLLDREIPMALWQIDMPHATRVGPRHVRLFDAKLAITPTVQCHISGSAVRGPITLHCQGRDIIADVPILAHVEANNIAGMVSAQADGKAMAHARITVSIAPDWKASGTVALSYDRTGPPAIMLLGQRITFTDKADPRLKPMIAGLERKLPQPWPGWICVRRLMVCGSMVLP